MQGITFAALLIMMWQHTRLYFKFNRALDKVLVGFGGASIVTMIIFGHDFSAFILITTAIILSTKRKDNGEETARDH